MNGGIPWGFLTEFYIIPGNSLIINVYSASAPGLRKQSGSKYAMNPGTETVSINLLQVSCLTGQMIKTSSES